MAYKVKQGDTLSELYGSDWKNLSGYTGDPTKLQIGTELPDLPGATPSASKEVSPISADTLNDIKTPVDLDVKEKLVDSSGVSLAGVGQPEGDATQKAGEAAMPSWLKSYIDTSEAPTDPTETYNKLYEQGEIDKKTQIVNDLTAQLNTIAAENTARNLELENQSASITSGGVARSQNANIRETAIRALPIQAQLDAAQNNLTAATNKLNTAFKIQSEYETNLYNYNKDLRDKVYEYASAEEKAKLDAQAKLDDREYDEKQEMIKNAQSIAKYAMENENVDIASQITALDSSSDTYAEDVAKLQSQIVEKVDPMEALDQAHKRAQIIKLQKETNLLGQPTEKEKQAEIDALNSAQGQIETLQDKLDLIDLIETGNASKGKASRVGTWDRKTPVTGEGFFGAISNFATGAKNFIAGQNTSDITGSGQEFAGAVHRLASQEFLDKLINVKSQGATFGALSDREGEALRAAGTQLNDWEIKDKNGNPTGIWDINEAAFDREVNRIKQLAQTAVTRAQGSLLSNDEKDILDQVYINQNVSSYYNQ